MLQKRKEPKRKSIALSLMRDVQGSAAEKLRMFENPFPHRSQPSESYVANQTSAAIGADEVTGPERLNATRCADTCAYAIGLARILSARRLTVDGGRVRHH